MSNININVANKISLAEAARITGYHQDYLGQLCRGGKLKATKYGRNWFTTTEAIEDFRKALLSLFENQPTENTIESETLDEVMDQPILQASTYAAPSYQTSQNNVVKPALTETVIVSQVEGLPIQIKTLPVVPRGSNTVQQLITNLKIESLQNAVGDIRHTLQEVLSELSRQSAILESKPWLREGILRSGHSSAFEFHQPAFNVPVQNDFTANTEKRKGGLGDWLLVGVVAGCFAFMTYSAITLQLFGSGPAVTNIEYSQTPSDNAGSVSGAMTAPMDISQETPVTQANLELLKLQKEYLDNQKVNEMIGGASIGGILQN